MHPYRIMINRQIVVRLHSVSRKTAWMLVPHADDTVDKFVDMADIAGIDLIC